MLRTDTHSVFTETGTSLWVNVCPRRPARDAEKLDQACCRLKAAAASATEKVPFLTV